eukprot:13600071-Alexandrium_andersonii.AAC.1
MTGRQVLWVIGSFFRTKQECGGIYLINDLASITLPNNANDAQLRRFYDLWMKIYQGQYDQSVPPILAPETLLTQLRKATGLVG